MIYSSNPPFANQGKVGAPVVLDPIYMHAYVF